jgi:uncharacterized protein YndB with AHSA1/START domain
VSSRILVSLRVAASPARAFAVFTGEIGRWWRPNGLFRFTAHDTGRLAFEPGPNGRLTEAQPDGSLFEIGRITSWEPGARLAFTWRQASFAAGQSTHVEVRFEPIGAETRVTVEHTGWDAIPIEHAARHRFPDAIFLQRHGEWWQLLLASLRGQIGN